MICYLDVLNACNVLELGLIELARILTDISEDTTIDVYDLTVDEVRCRRSEEYSETLEVLCLAPALCRCLRTDETIKRSHGTVCLLRTKRSGLRSRDVARSDRVTLNIVLTILRADVLREHLEAALGSCVSRYGLTTKLRHHGAGVDDLTIALLDHTRKDSLCAEERTGEVDIDDLIPLLLRHLDHRDSLDDTGIIYQDIDTAKLLLYILHECIYLLLVRNVTYDTVCIDTELLILCDTSVNELLIDIIENDLLCASLRKCLRICKTQS